MQAPEEKARGITIATAHGGCFSLSSRYSAADLALSPCFLYADVCLLAAAAQWSTRRQSGIMHMWTAPATPIM